MGLKVFKDNDKKEILSKGVSFLFIRVLGLFAGYAFTYLVARFYGAEVYGLVVLGFSLFVFIGVLGRLGVDVNLVKFYSSEEKRSDKGLFYRVVLKSFFFSSTLAFILYLTRGFFANVLFEKPAVETYLIWVALAIPFWSLTLVCAGYLRAIKMNHWFAFLNNSGRFLFTILFLMVLWSIVDAPLNAIKAHTFGVIVLAILGFFLCVRHFGGISLKTESNSWHFLRAAFPMMLSTSMLVLLGWIDTFTLGIYETERNIGIYNVALKLATLTSFTLQAINSILAPKLADSFRKEKKDQFSKLIRFSTKLNFLTTLVIVILIVVSHKWILALFGSEFVAGSLILLVLCAGQLVNSFSGSVGVILQMTGHQKTYQNIVLAALLLNIILNFALIPAYGNLGAAIATASSMACRNVLAVGYLKRKLGIVSYYDFR
ncbi:MAG: flippase [Bacteroidota bacterium]